MSNGCLKGEIIWISSAKSEVSDMFALSKPIRGTQVKIVFLGDDKVGKTSIIRRFVDDVFKESYRPTLGVQVLTKEHYEYPLDPSQDLVIYLWDIGAQQLYEIVRPDYYVGIAGAIFVGDVTRPDIIKNLKFWFTEVKTHVRYPFGWMVALNKVDVLDDKNGVPEKAMQLVPKEMRENNRVLFTSAKTNQNVEELILRVLSQVFGPSNTSTVDL